MPPGDRARRMAPAPGVLRGRPLQSRGIRASRLLPRLLRGRKRGRAGAALQSRSHRCGTDGSARAPYPGRVDEMNAGNSTAYRTAAFTAPDGGAGAPLLRWYLWEGGFLVVGQAAGEVPAHSHHAIQISLKLDGAAAIRGTGGTWREGRGIIVRSDVEHSFDAQGGTGALLFVDPESSEGIWLQSVLMEDITFAPPARVERCVDELRAFIERPLEGMDPGDLVRHCVAAFCSGVPPSRRLDARVTTFLK